MMIALEPVFKRNSPAKGTWVGSEAGFVFLLKVYVP
jgi:hypothetical protein